MVFLQVRWPELPARVWFGDRTAPTYDTSAVLASLERGFQPVTAKLRSRRCSTPRIRREGGLLTLLNSPVFFVLAVVIMVVVLAWALFRAGKRDQAASARGSLRVCSHFRIGQIR